MKPQKMWGIFNSDGELADLFIFPQPKYPEFRRTSIFYVHFDDEGEIHLNKKYTDLGYTCRQIVVSDAEPCHWQRDTSTDSCYDTECGNAFEFMFDGPEENMMAYCPYCGRKVVIDPPKEIEE